jgi:hypothetical protein
MNIKPRADVNCALIKLMKKVYARCKSSASMLSLLCFQVEIMNVNFFYTVILHFEMKTLN